MLRCIEAHGEPVEALPQASDAYCRWATEPVSFAKFLGNGMFEYEIKRFNRRCFKTDREFQPGDVYYSALVESGDQFVRQDYSDAAWEGPPPDTVGWWRCQAAPLNPHRVYWAPSGVLLEYFSRLAANPSQKELCYLMALLLLRKKLIHLVEGRSTDSTDQTMTVHAPRLKQDFTIAVCEPPAGRLRELEAELCQNLFTDRPTEAAEADTNPVLESQQN